MEIAKSAIQEQEAFKKPVTYWRLRMQEAKRAANELWSRFLFTLISFVSFILILNIASSFFITPLLATIEADGNVITPDIQWRILPFILSATVGLFGVWILRLIVRQFIAQRHQIHDAGERLAILNTYLSLLETRQLEESERLIFLEAIARKSSDGLVTDDASPTSDFTSILKRNN